MCSDIKNHSLTYLLTYFTYLLKDFTPCNRCKLFILACRSCGSSVAATWTLFSVLFSRRFMCDKKFHDVLCASPPPRTGSWRRLCMNRLSATLRLPALWLASFSRHLNAHLFQH